MSDQFSVMVYKTEKTVEKMQWKMELRERNQKKTL